MSEAARKRIHRYKASARVRMRVPYNRTLMRLRRGFANGSRTVAHKTGQQGNEVIKRLIEGPNPVMIARWGSTELAAIASFRSGAGPEELQRSLEHLHRNAGFFPARIDLLPRFVGAYEEAARQLDCLAVWNFKHGRFEMEERAFRDYSPNAALVDIRCLESWLHGDPWTSSLEGKRVLVVHPFEKSIREQYAKRRYLFKDERVLPQFESLLTLRAVQSIAGNLTGFDTWFDALDAMCSEIESREFDVALIGAGAYGMPLAGFVKRLGRKAVHMGGSTQILFGIMGKKWEKRLARFVNDYWTRPLPEETPPNYQEIEEGCYW